MVIDSRKILSDCPTVKNIPERQGAENNSDSGCLASRSRLKPNRRQGERENGKNEQRTRPTPCSQETVGEQRAANTETEHDWPTSSLPKLCEPDWRAVNAMRAERQQ